MKPSDSEEMALKTTQQTELYLGVDTADPIRTESVTSSVATPSQVFTTAASSRGDDMTETKAMSHADVSNLLEALAQAFRPIMNTSHSAVNLTHKKYTLTTVISKSTTTASKQSALATRSSRLTSTDAITASPSFHPAVKRIQQMSTSFIPGIKEPRGREIDPYSPESEVALSLLDSVSDLVAEVARINAEPAASLADSMLVVLPVDPGAISSVVLTVAEQASVSVEAVVPLILPAISRAWGNPAKAVVFNGEPEDLNATFKEVVSRGTIVINQIAAASALIKTTLMQDVLQQVADILYAVSNHLNQTVCAVSQNNAVLKLEALVPCESANLESGSMMVLTLNPTTVVTGSLDPTSSAWNIIPPASPGGYSMISNVLPSYSLSSISSTSESLPSVYTTPSQPSVVRQTVPCTTIATTTTMPSLQTVATSSQPCPTYPVTVMPGPESKSGPCPERGYQCKECLNGWFCPPQETPPQVVPCGLGWPCFHCTDGYFCSSTVSSEPSTCISSSSGSPLIPATTPAVNMPGSAPALEPSRNFDVPVSGWTYLGCFQDAISRILVGSKPVDYLRASMSNSTCINHCIANGYSFAGTEHGFECWCGSSIRDDAVRLPENSCNVPCQDSANEFCGGSWIISVFRYSEDHGDAQPSVDTGTSSAVREGQASLQFPSSSHVVTKPQIYQQAASPSELSLTTADSVLPSNKGVRTQTTSATKHGPVAQLLAKARHSQ